MIYQYSIEVKSEDERLNFEKMLRAHNIPFRKSAYISTNTLTDTSIEFKLEEDMQKYLDENL